MAAADADEWASGCQRALTEGLRFGSLLSDVIWSFTGLAFGLLCQVSMAVTGTTPERIGFLLPMSALLVDALLGVSILMLGGRWMIRRMLQRA